MGSGLGPVGGSAKSKHLPGEKGTEGCIGKKSPGFARRERFDLETERPDIKHDHEHSQRECSDNRRHDNQVRTNSRDARTAE